MKKTEQAKKVPLLVVVLVWIVAVLAVLAVTVVAGWSLAKKSVTSVENEYVVKFNVADGASVKSVAYKLKEQKLIRSNSALYIAARFNVFSPGKRFVLKSGTYTVKSSMNLEDIYFLLQSGEQEYVSVSIPEGLTMTKVGALLESNKVCSASSFVEKCRDPELLAKYGIAGESMEGFLFPDTYFFVVDSTAETCVRTMADNFFKRIGQVPDFNGLSGEKLYDVVTLASIVEREYRVTEEAPLIASVFSNRLRHGIGLYSCATVEYFLTEILGRPHPDKITYKDLKIDNPYNTYMWAGLTPGPISNPGMVALKAAVNPPRTNYYFFVLTDPAKGTHTFSTSFDEHKAADSVNSYSRKVTR